MKPVNVVCMFLFLSFSNACNKPQGPQGTVVCACDQFPFPKACSSRCETGQVQIESVNAKNQTAMIVIRHGAQSESQTIPLARLPVGVPAQRGASFTALLKKEVAEASAATPSAAGSRPGPAAPPPSVIPQIVRFTARP